MSTNPPPFGDPTNNDQANARTVRKGVALGCGGCAFLAVMGLVCLAGLGFLVVSLIRGDETCALTFKAAQASEVLKRELGEPMRMGWLVTGDISTVNGNGTVNVTVPIIGPKGQASVHTMGTRDHDAPWVFTRMEATISATGQTVDLR